eukprot:scaffold81146_cov21-Tisochrysis_lutea.AAC.3
MGPQGAPRGLLPHTSRLQCHALHITYYTTLVLQNTHQTLGTLRAVTLARLHKATFLDALEALQRQHGAATQAAQPAAHLIACLHLHAQGSTTALRCKHWWK